MRKISRQARISFAAWMGLALLASVAAMACAGGVPQEELDNAKEETTALEGDNATLKGDNAALKEQTAALEGDNATLKQQAAALEGNNATLTAQTTALETDNAALAGIRDAQAELRDLRDAADIKFELAAAAVDRSRAADWDLAVGPGLVETALGRLGEFIEDAQGLTVQTQALAEQVSVEDRSVYEKSARLYEAKITEASYLKELLSGLSFQRTTQSEIEGAHFTCLMPTDQMRTEWDSKLEEAIAHHQAGIGIASQAEEAAPELSFKFGEAITDLETLIAQAAAQQGDSAAPSNPTSGDDHGDSIAEATEAVLPCSLIADIGNANDRDYFSFTAAAGTTYVVRMGLGTLTYGTVYLLDSSGRQLTAAEVYEGRENPLAYTATTAGTLYVSTQDRNNTTGSYTLSIAVPSDDHGNAMTAATAVEVSSSNNGLIEYQGDQDYFSFEAQAGATYVVGVGLGTLSYAGISLFGPSGQ